MYLVNLHSLDLACMSYMGTSAQVNQGPTSKQNQKLHNNSLYEAKITTNNSHILL